MSLRASGPHDLANDEVRTTALLFVLRGLLKGQDAHNGDDKDAVLKALRQVSRGARLVHRRISITARASRARC